LKRNTKRKRARKVLFEKHSTRRLPKASVKSSQTRILQSRNSILPMAGALAPVVGWVVD
jgi:hypothetical protein